MRKRQIPPPPILPTPLEYLSICRHLVDVFPTNASSEFSFTTSLRGYLHTPLLCLSTHCHGDPPAAQQPQHRAHLRCPEPSRSHRGGRLSWVRPGSGVLRQLSGASGVLTFFWAEDSGQPASHQHQHQRHARLHLWHIPQFFRQRTWQVADRFLRVQVVWLLQCSLRWVRLMKPSFTLGKESVA